MDVDSYTSKNFPQADKQLSRLKALLCFLKLLLSLLHCMMLTLLEHVRVLSVLAYSSNMVKKGVIETKFLQTNL